MEGEKNLSKLLKTMKPKHHIGDYVFCMVNDPAAINFEDITLLFKEEEGYTLVLQKKLADNLKLEYGVVMAWISLTVHSSLEAVGLTAAFSTALSRAGISCNVVAAFYHDHIFVNKKDAEKAMKILNALSA